MIEVKLIDKMGSDLTVVNAARVSFHKESTVLTEKDKKLIEYLAKHKHTTPFRHVQFVTGKQIGRASCRERVLRLV